MQHKFSILWLSVALILAAVLFTACPPPQKTLSDVLKDLPAESYSLNFQELKKDPILTQTQYGTSTAETLMDIDDLCPPLKKLGYKKFPRVIVWPPTLRTILPPPTIRDGVPPQIKDLVPPQIRDLVPPRPCPDFVPWKFKDLVLEAISHSNWAYAKDLTAVKVGDYALLGTKEVFGAYASVQPDSMDLMGMQKVSLDKVFVLTPNNSFFKRGWYGEAELGKTGLTFGKFKEVFPPKQIGCFDPEQLTLLRENLLAIDKTRFAGLNVKEIQGVQGSVLSY